MKVIKKTDQKVDLFGNTRISHAFEFDGMLYVKTAKDTAITVATALAEHRKFGELDRVFVVDTLSYTIERGTA